MSTLKRLTLILILTVLTACSATPTSALAGNRQKWEAKNITHYRFNLAIGCFCAFSDKMPLSIEIQDGQVVSMVDNQGQPVTEFKETFDQYNSIEKLFATLDAAENAATENGGADKVTVTYNAEFGYPESVYIDYIEMATDDEIGFTVSEFESLP